jgi:hypothetical protein
VAALSPSMASLAEDGWPALAAALAGGAAAEQERLLRADLFREPWLVQWRFSAPLLARARAHLAAAAARRRRADDGRGQG